MKTKNTFRTVLVAALVALVSAVYAGSPVPAPKKAEQSTRKTVQRYFKFPSILVSPLNSEQRDIEKVEVLFTTDAKGKVNFVVAKTSNLELKAEIEKQFYKMPFKEGHENVVQKVILNFKVV